jgi:A/G-specific adenine glycosylase
MARLYAVETALPTAKRALAEKAGALVTPDRPGDWAQALMDLGAMICTPRSPRCEVCPWTRDCAAYAAGAPESYPRRAAKAERPKRFGAAFRVRRGHRLWLVRRPERGLLAGMAGLPTTEWRAEPWSQAEVEKAAPFKATWASVGQVRHVFTHFALTLEVWCAAETGPPASSPALRRTRSARLPEKQKRAGEDAGGPHRWIAVGEIGEAGLPTVFRKAVDRARGSG